MEDSPVHDMTISSHSGPYTVEFANDLLEGDRICDLGTHYIVDRNVHDRLPSAIRDRLSTRSIYILDANEDTKSYHGVEPIIEAMVENGLKRSSVLVAIGGGITQDVTCFIATNFMRGVKWLFVPTTLLAQADSCIGSKSSINFGNTKNLLGSFNPPSKVIICEGFLSTLDPMDIRSGIGEIIKLYLIDGRKVSVDEIMGDISSAVRETLMIKKRYIEEDEFDKGIRNILNYGHCFGHAIESSTGFAIPHGIAITIGMDAANRLALMDGLIDQDGYDSMHRCMVENYLGYANTVIPVDMTLKAMTHDKKNTGNTINVIVPDGSSIVKKGFDNTPSFWEKAGRALRALPVTTG
jgi:3-dehydroquinate synthase